MVFAQLGAGDLLHHGAPAPARLPDGAADHDVLELEDLDTTATGKFPNLIRARQVLALKPGHELLLRGGGVLAAIIPSACSIAGIADRCHRVALRNML